MILRIEPVLDPARGRYFLELYHPAEAASPFITTAPRYMSAEAAEQDVLAILAAAASRPGGAAASRPARPGPLNIAT